MPTVPVRVGPRGRILKFVRRNHRCPYDDFMSSCTQRFKDRFEGSFETICDDLGADYVLKERFTVLHGNEAKPLWEFKEHDHRLYCTREVAGGNVRIVLLSGWVKDKEGKATREEKREIAKAKDLYKQYLAEG